MTYRLENIKTLPGWAWCPTCNRQHAIQVSVRAAWATKSWEYLTCPACFQIQLDQASIVQIIKRDYA